MRGCKVKDFSYEALQAIGSPSENIVVCELAECLVGFEDLVASPRWVYVVGGLTLGIGTLSGVGAAWLTAAIRPPFEPR